MFRDKARQDTVAGWWRFIRSAKKTSKSLQRYANFRFFGIFRVRRGEKNYQTQEWCVLTRTLHIALQSFWILCNKHHHHHCISRSFSVRLISFGQIFEAIRARSATAAITKMVFVWSGQQLQPCRHEVPTPQTTYRHSPPNILQSKHAIMIASAAAARQNTSAFTTSIITSLSSPLAIIIIHIYLDNHHSFFFFLKWNLDSKPHAHGSNEE